MTAQYSPPPAWKAPSSLKPSMTCFGESSPSVIHQAVGRATSSWEHAESATVKLFQVLCEAKSLAASRAFGTIESSYGRHFALKYAAEEFFNSRDKEDLKLSWDLINTYKSTGEYRNQLAHGMAIQPHEFGYFLSAPSYAARRRATPRPNERWGLGSSYFFTVREIDLFRDRFDQLREAFMSLTIYLNVKYQVLNSGDLHP